MPFGLLLRVFKRKDRGKDSEPEDITVPLRHRKLP
jgi:hypothetical protein